MDTVEMLIETYTKVADGQVNRCDLESDGVKVKAYKVGAFIRIDITGED
jgi:hypothetical protein